MPGSNITCTGTLALPRLAGKEIGARLSAPRISPLVPGEWTPQQRELITPQIGPDGSVLNLYSTLIRHPRLYTPRASFGTYLQKETGLPPWTRELLIMRTSFLIGTEYEWAHHVAAARAAGLTDVEIARIAGGPEADGWSDEQRAVLRAADELRREAHSHHGSYVGDPGAELQRQTARRDRLHCRRVHDDWSCNKQLRDSG